MHQDSVPPEDSWGNWRADLDQVSAHAKFAGKTLDEAKSVFEDGPHAIFDELLFVPAIPFQYYVMGFRDYVLRCRPELDIDACENINCFLSLVIGKLEAEPEAIRPVLAELMSTAELIVGDKISLVHRNLCAAASPTSSTKFDY